MRRLCYRNSSPYTVWTLDWAGTSLPGIEAERGGAPRARASGVRRTYSRGSYLRGASTMIAIPASATKAPAVSQALGRSPSTSHSHNSATAMYTPP
jgi:hypothetical protein